MIERLKKYFHLNKKKKRKKKQVKPCKVHRKGKKKKNKLIEILVYTNIFIILSIISIYSYRFIHYYRIEHPSIESLSLMEALTIEKNITYDSSGFYKVDNDFIYKGNPLNNYVRYKGLIWLAYFVDNEKIKLISDDILYLNNWNSDISQDIELKIGYALTGEASFLISDNNYFSLLSIEEFKNGTVKIKEHEEVIEANLFFKEPAYYLSDMIDDAHMVCNDDQLVKAKQGNYYGIRPVITMKGNIDILGGIGTNVNPFIIDYNSNALLGGKYQGEYVKLYDKLYRIIESNQNHVKLIEDGLIDTKMTFSNNNIYQLDNGIGRYLNSEYLESFLDKDLLIESDFFIGDIYNPYSKTMSAKVGMPKIDDLFVPTLSDYFLITPNNYYQSTIYHYIFNNLYATFPTYEAYIRPVLSLRGDLLTINGNGTKENPYIIEGRTE